MISYSPFHQCYYMLYLNTVSLIYQTYLSKYSAKFSFVSPHIVSLASKSLCLIPYFTNLSQNFESNVMLSKIIGHGIY